VVLIAILAVLLFGGRPPWLDRFEDDARERRGLPPKERDEPPPPAAPTPAPGGGQGARR
jgi:hypothetical protein